MSASTSLGTFIKTKRQAAGLSIRELAKRAELHYSYLSRIESGEHERLRPDDIQRIADALGIDPNRLLRFMGVKTATIKLPTPRVYFRRAYHLTAAEAKEAERQMEGILEGLRNHTTQSEPNNRKEETSL